VRVYHTRIRASAQYNSSFYSGSKADIWSLGVSLFVMATVCRKLFVVRSNVQLNLRIHKKGRFPFDDPNSKKLTAKIKAGQV